jgi:hypothetical protein
MLRRELEGPGGCAHPQALGPSCITDDWCVHGRDGAHVRVGWNTHERRVNTVWEAIEVPPCPRAIDGGRDVAFGARLLLSTPCTWGGRPHRTDEDENNEKGQYDNDGLHLYRL